MFIESGGEERNGRDAAHARRLEKLRRDFGPTFLAALEDPETIDILLNADGTLWQQKVASAAAISITAAPAERSCQGRTAHTGSRAPIPAGSARRSRVVSSVRANAAAPGPSESSAC